MEKSLDFCIRLKMGNAGIAEGGSRKPEGERVQLGELNQEFYAQIN